MDTLLAQISSVERLTKQIDKQYQKFKTRGTLFNQSQDGVSAYTFALKQHDLAKQLSKALQQQSFQLTPARHHLIETHQKERHIYLYPLLDQLIISSIADTLQEALTPTLSSHSYAYQSGKQPVHVLEQLGHFLKKPQNERGVYMIKADILQYSDHIPVHARSPLWRLLKQLLEKGNITTSDYSWRLLQQVIRTEVMAHEKISYTKTLGMPTGSAICPVIYNLYLSEVDDIISRHPGVFYARYSDDILMAHTNANTLSQLDETLSSLMQDLFLTRKKEKEEFCFLNKAGKTLQPEWPGKNSLEYLGFTIHAKGYFSIGKRQRQFILATIKKRLHNVARLNRSTASIEEPGRLLCKTMNTLLLKGPFQDFRLARLVVLGNDQRLLKEFDYLIAKEIANILTQTNSVKAFRQVPYQKMRHTWGLLSLVSVKNKGLPDE